MNLALYSGSYEVFHLIAEKVFTSQELLFEYIIKNEILLKLMKNGNDRFALALMEEYFKLLDKYGNNIKLLDNGIILPIKYERTKNDLQKEKIQFRVIKTKSISSKYQNKVALNNEEKNNQEQQNNHQDLSINKEESKMETDEKINYYEFIFYFICQNKMKKSFYKVLEYSLKYLCNNDISIFKEFITDILNQKLSDFDSKDQKAEFSCIELAWNNKFYEVFSFMDEYDIPIIHNECLFNLIKDTDNYIFNNIEEFSKIPEVNSFNQYYRYNIKLFTKMNSYLDNNPNFNTTTIMIIIRNLIDLLCFKRNFLKIAPEYFLTKIKENKLAFNFLLKIFISPICSNQFTIHLLLPDIYAIKDEISLLYLFDKIEISVKEDSGSIITTSFSDVTKKSINFWSKPKPVNNILFDTEIDDILEKMTKSSLKNYQKSPLVITQDEITELFDHCIKKNFRYSLLILGILRPSILVNSHKPKIENEDIIIGSYWYEAMITDFTLIVYMLPYLPQDIIETMKADIKLLKERCRTPNENNVSIKAHLLVDKECREFFKLWLYFLITREENSDVNLFYEENNNEADWANYFDCIQSRYQKDFVMIKGILEEYITYLESHNVLEKDIGKAQDLNKASDLILDVFLKAFNNVNYNSKLININAKKALKSLLHQSSTNNSNNSGYHFQIACSLSLMFESFILQDVYKNLDNLCDEKSVTINIILEDKNITNLQNNENEFSLFIKLAGNRHIEINSEKFDKLIQELKYKKFLSN